MKTHEKYNEENSRITTNPWMAVSILLGILLIMSFGTNIFIITKLSGSATGVAPSAGEQLAPSPLAAAPSQPSAPAQRVAISVDDDPALGPKDAKVTVIEFGDYQCPFCKRFHEGAWQQLKVNYVDTNKVRFVYRDFPLGFHQNAQKASEASQCANDQGKFWEYHEILYTKGQGDGSGLDDVSLKQYAVDLKLETGIFNNCLDSGKHKDEVQKDMADGAAAGVSGTPSFFINGRQLVGAQPYVAFQQLIDAELAK